LLENNVKDNFLSAYFLGFGRPKADSECRTFVILKSQKPLKIKVSGIVFFGDWNTWWSFQQTWKPGGLVFLSVRV